MASSRYFISQSQSRKRKTANQKVENVTTANYKAENVTTVNHKTLNVTTANLKAQSIVFSTCCK